MIKSVGLRWHVAALEVFDSYDAVGCDGDSVIAVVSDILQNKK